MIFYPKLSSIGGKIIHMKSTVLLWWMMRNMIEKLVTLIMRLRLRWSYLIKSPKPKLLM